MKKIMDGTAPASSLPPEPAEPIQSPLTEKAFQRRKPVFNPTGKVEQILASETKIADVRRHPFGLIVIYLQFIFGTGLAIGLLVFLLPGVVGTDSAGVDASIGILVLFMAVFGAIFLILATKIYRGNQLIITDNNITSVQQTGLFSRKVSELTMADIEDVTANTNGVFPTLFNFGTVSVETAGEQNNFVFKFCPNPNAYAKVMQDARMEFMQKHGPQH